MQPDNAPADDEPSLSVSAIGVMAVILFIVIVLVTTVGPMALASGAGMVDAGEDTIEVSSAADSVALQDSSGYGVLHASSSSAVTAPSDGGAGANTSTAVTWVALDADAVQIDDYHVLNLGNGAASVQYQNGSWYAYYNQTNGGVAEVTAPAPNPTDRSMVGYAANETHLQIVRDGQVRNATAFADTNASVPPARSWWGTQDELRVWGTTLNASQLSALASDPIGPLAQNDQTMRLMLDEGSGSSTRVLPGSTSGTLTGAVTWTGDGLEPTDYIAGQDYRYDGGSTIEIIGGSRLDQMSVAFVEYQSQWAELISQFNAVLILLGLVLLVGGAYMILRELNGVGGGGFR